MTHADAAAAKPVAPVTTYDLARDIARRLEERGDWFFVDRDEDDDEGDEDVCVIEQHAVLIIESVIVEALKSGGVRP